MRWIKKRNTTEGKTGFTTVEVLIIAPIVILSIGAFIALIVTLTGDVMRTRGANTLSANIQSALNQIEQDIRLSGGILPSTNITLTSPQGFDNDTTAFKNVGPTNGNALILNMYTTHENPATSPGSIVYRNSPILCDSPDVYRNEPVMMNVVYFVKDDSLWRRTILPPNYDSVACPLTPVWQQPSCLPGVSMGGFCKTRDSLLVRGLSLTDDFDIEYFSDVLGSEPLPDAIDPDLSDILRLEALETAQFVSISISARQVIAGKDIAHSATVRSVINAIDTSPSELYNPPVITSHPVSQLGITAGASVNLSGTATGANISYQWQKSTNSGSSWVNIPGASFPHYFISSMSSEHAGLYRLRVTNQAGSVVSNPAQLAL
jgi:hypothetical protein